MMNRKTAAFALLATLTLAFAPGCAEQKADTKADTKAAAGETAKADPFKRMSADEVATKIEESKAGKLKLYIYDNNNKEQFDKARVPGAKWVQFDDVKASDLPAEKDATLVFYCANEKCSACHSGAMAAVKLGYTNVYIMPDGIQGWQKGNKPVENS